MSSSGITQPTKLESSEYCEKEEWTGAYTSYLIPICVFLVLQLSLLINAAYYECKQEKTLLKVSKSIRYSYIVLIVCGLYWLIVDLSRFLIDPFVFAAQNSIGFCGILAYSPKAIAILFYAIYCHQLLERLKLSFDRSFLELSKRTIIILSVLVYTPAILIPAVYFATLPPHCVQRWTPKDFPDFNSDANFAFCDVGDTVGLAGAIVLGGIAWVVIDNLILGAIFGAKLKKMLTTRQLSSRSSIDDTNNPHGMNKHSFKLKAVMIKNSLLMIIAVSSTLLNWFFWVLVSSPLALGPVSLYFDIWLNCLLIGLMFKYNEYYYKKWCKCCVKICFLSCDKTMNAEWKEKREKQVDLYLNNDLSRMRSQLGSTWSIGSRRKNKNKSNYKDKDKDAVQTENVHTNTGSKDLEMITTQPTITEYDANPDYEE